MAELKTEKQNRVSANEKAQKNASEVEQQNEIYRDKILELEDEKYKLQEQVEGIKNAIHFQASDLEKVKSEGIQYIKGSFKLWFHPNFTPLSSLFHSSAIQLDTFWWNDIWTQKELNIRQTDLDERIKESIKKSTDCLKEHMKSFDEERTKLIEDYEAELKPIKDEMEDLKAQEITKESIFIKFPFQK